MDGNTIDGQAEAGKERDTHKKGKSMWAAWYDAGVNRGGTAVTGLQYPSAMTNYPVIGADRGAVLQMSVSNAAAECKGEGDLGLYLSVITFL